MRAFLLLSLLAATTAGCRQFESEVEATAPMSICVGEAAFVETSANVSLDAMTVTSTFIRGALSGQVMSANPNISPTGAIREVRADTMSNGEFDDPLAFEFACLRPGMESFIVVADPTDEDLSDLRTTVAVECMDCGNPDPIGDFIDSVSSNSPRCRRSRIRAAIGLSVAAHLFVRPSSSPLAAPVPFAVTATPPGDAVPKRPSGTMR